MSEVRLGGIFKALANRRRLKMLDFLNKNGYATVTEISEHLELSLNATLRHVLKLAEVHMVDRIQRGTYMFYCVDTYANVLVH